MSKVPGISYPQPIGHTEVDQAIRNIYDNLFYLKRLGETIPVSIADGGTGATSSDEARTNLAAAKSGGIKAGSVTLAKITGGGSNGSISWNSDGCITSFTPPT